MWRQKILIWPDQGFARELCMVPRTDEFLKNHQEFPSGSGNFHGSAEVRYRVSDGNNEEFNNMVPEKDLGNKPLIGLRVYPDVVSVLGIGLYQDVYKTHRTNICADQTCKWGVYAYPDMREAVNSIQSEPGKEKALI